MFSTSVSKGSLGKQIVDFFSNIFFTDFWPARWHCGRWTDFHGWFYIASELMIWAAYFAIPVMLFRIIMKRTDLPFPRIFFLFCAFILLCGSTHLMDAVIFWWPAYRLSAVLRFITGVVSVSTVVALYKVIPSIFTLKTAQQLENEIEQRRLAEERAQAQFNELQHVLDASLDIICTVNDEGEFVKINKAAEQILGYSANELIGKRYIEFVHPDDLKATLNCADELFAGTPTTGFVNRYKRKEGDYIYISWKSTLSEDGKSCFSIARDVSEFKYQQFTQEKLNNALIAKIEELQEKDKTLEKIQELKFLADSIPQIVWTATPDGKIDYFNRHWYEYTGLDQNQSLSVERFDIIHPDDEERCLQVWAESNATGNPYQIEYRFKNAADGQYRWHLGRALPMFNAKGEIVKWYGSCTEIDMYKRALDLENKLSQYEDFNRIVAHNLRGPAGSIEMILNLFADARIDEERETYIDMLRGASKSLNNTLDDLMKVLEIRLNKNVEYHDCSVEGLLDGVKMQLIGQITTSKALIETDLQVEIVKFPRIYLESIIYNMISNSLKYRRNDVAPHIKVSSEKVEDKIVLRFKDNGLGIDLKRHRANMFKLNKVFHRGYDSKGVGLFMTKAQIESFGGSINVESEPNVGTEFIVTL